MDKAEFLKVAPSYYSVAIIAVLEARSAPATHDELVQIYGSSIEIWRIFESSVSWLKRQGIVDILSDPFGPLIIVKTEDFVDKVNKLGDDATFPLYKHRLMPVTQGDAWLKSALRELNGAFSRLEFTDEDFDEPPDKEWEPLPLERENPQLQRAIKAVDDVVEKVRADNGYTANVPEERDYVLDRLSTLSKRLKEASSTSFAFVKRNGFEPLSLLLKRFGPAAIGLVATAAKEALREWLRQKGITFLDWL